MKTNTARELMKKKDITVSELAKRLKVSERTIYRYLAGKARTITKIAVDSVIDRWGE